MNDINIGVCPICRQQFDLSDGVPCDCVEEFREGGWYTWGMEEEEDDLG